MTAELPESLRSVARDAAAAGLGELDEDQLLGMACVRCRRTKRLVPLPGWFGAVDGVSGGVQLFECERGNPQGCQTGTECSSIPSVVRHAWRFGPSEVPAEPRPPVYLALDLEQLRDLVAGRDVRAEGSQGRSASERQPVEVRMALRGGIEYRELGAALADATGQFLRHQLEAARLSDAYDSTTTPDSHGGPAAPAPSRRVRPRSGDRDS